MLSNNVVFQFLLFSIFLLIGSSQEEVIITTPTPETFTSEPSETIPNDLDNIIADMTGDHEGFPRGVPTDGGEAWSWVYHPRISYGNDMPSDWSATISWGQVYAEDSGTALSTTRFQIRNLNLWMLRKSDSTWVQLIHEPDDILGANYAEDFENDSNVKADIRDESNKGGGISVNVARGYNFHFFSQNRAEFDPTEIAGMWSFFEARIVPDQAPEHYDSAIMASAGGDYWESMTAEWNQWKTNGDWAIGRFKYITKDWQTFNAHTLDEATLRQFPPPVE